MPDLRARSRSSTDAIFLCRDDSAVPQSPPLRAAALEKRGALDRAIADVEWNGIRKTAFQPKNTAPVNLIYQKSTPI